MYCIDIYLVRFIKFFMWNIFGDGVFFNIGDDIGNIIFLVVLV